jgi:hypothetical protein
MRRRRVARVAVGSAVIAGTAGAVHHHQDKKYAQEDYEQQQEMYEQQEQYAPPPELAPPPPADPPQDDLVSQLERLAALKDQGILTEEEFAAQKAKLLGT